jgi:predicted Rossmann-fold nucleotide-binding protein
MNTLPPFNPHRRALYDHRELLAGFDAADPASFARTPDFEIYRHYLMTGGAEADDYFITMMQSLHDHAITQNIRRLLAGPGRSAPLGSVEDSAAAIRIAGEASVDDKRCAAIMGGHKMSRSQPEYRRVAMLSRALTRAGFLVASGGGPGAMESTHLGASLSDGAESDLDAALKTLATAPDLPGNLREMVKSDGTVDEAAVKDAHRWYAPALEIARGFPARLPQSLAIPTWHYGHEPSTPLASHIGKYFQNSIREDGLLTFATDGIVFTEGKAGTIQEIFQDAAQNYYKSVKGRFSPMVFLGIDYWTNHYPVNLVLHALFQHEDYQKYVRFTDSPEEAVEFLVQSS